MEEVENLGSRAINYGARVNVGSLQDTLVRLVELDHKNPVEPKDESRYPARGGPIGSHTLYVERWHISALAWCEGR